MKKSIIVLLLFLPFLFGCNCGDNEDNGSNANTDKVELMTEIKLNDSIANEMENVKQEIEESSEELDELLKDL